MSTDLLTVPEAAARLGLTPSRVRQLIRAGRLPASRFGKSWAIAPADLAAFIPLPRGWVKGKPRKVKAPPP